MKNFASRCIRTIRRYEDLISWMKGRLSRNQFLIMSGILVGLSAGLAGVILKALVAGIHHLITEKVHFEGQLLFYLVFPFLGIVLTTVMVLVFFSGQDRKGIPAILYEIARNSSIVSHVKMYSQIFQSAVTVGLGGSAGLESPIAVTGAAIGSNYAQTYKLDYKDRTLLLAAGATAGIAASFNAPIAGVMFAFEILLTGVVFTDFIPLVVAAVCGSLLSKIILNEEVLFSFRTGLEFTHRDLPYFIVLGILCGLYARYFLAIGHFVEKKFKSWNASKLRKAILGGALLSLICVLLPPLFGEGYQTIKELTQGKTDLVIQKSFFRYLPYQSWMVLVFLGLVCAAKAFATSITIQSGGNGGNFAPSLFAGGAFGYFFATVCIHLGFEDVPVTNLVLVGMAGVISGVLYAPLTAIFLIAESSAGYDLFIPLMIVSVIAYLITVSFSRVSPDLETLAGEGKIFTREHDKNLLLLLDPAELIDEDTQTIRVDASMDDLLELIKNGRRNIIAVVNGEDGLEGIITLDDLRPYMFQEDAFRSLTVRKIVKAPPAVIRREDNVVQIIKKFDESGSWNLPALHADGRFNGFISKSTVLNRYRQLLKEWQ